MIVDRFWSKVNKADPEGCWTWEACKNSKGYGRFYSPEGRAVNAHRLAYEIAVGPVPGELHVDHLCRNPSCCNPDHLEPVTPGENSRRGLTGAHMARRTHCPRGHAYEEHGYREATGFRGCRACRNDRARAKRRAA